MSRRSCAAPHVSALHTTRSPIYRYHRAHAPSSTLHSSALEMCAWARANLRRGELDGQRILSDASYDLLWRPFAESEAGDSPEFVGLSWFLGTYRGRRRISHGGSDIGFQCSFALLPDEGIGVAVLANALPAPVSEIRQAAFDLLLGFEPERPRPPTLSRLGEVLASGDTATALAAFRALQGRQPDDYDFDPAQRIAAADALVESGRPRAAVPVLRLGIALDPDSAEGYGVLAWAYLRCGEPDHARAAVAEALHRDPHDRGALMIRARLASQ